MTFPRTVLKLALSGTIAAGALFGVAAASAGTSWSIGVSVPGVVVSEPAPVYYEPAPVYSRPAPVYYEPGPSWEERRAARREWRRREWERREHYRHYREDRD